MKSLYLFAFVFIVFMMLFTGVAGAASFTMQVKNSTSAYHSMDSNNTVYRGDTVKFTDTSSGSPTSWDWGFGDGFSSAYQNPEHTYAFGKQPIIMTNGYIYLNPTLKTPDGSVYSRQIKFTTHLQPLIIETDNVVLMNETLSKNYTEVLTGNQTAPPGWMGFDWVRGINTTIEAYTSILGETIFLILIFSIPFIMNWIVTKDFVVSGILGGFLGIFIIARLPAGMQMMAIGFIVMSVVAIIYSLLKET